jgi:hypothetical protein
MHLDTLAHFHDGAVQLSEEELHASNKLIAIMGLMCLLGQFGPAPVLVKALHKQWKQIIEAGWNNAEEEENETEHVDNNMEEKTASDVNVWTKRQKKGKCQLTHFHLCYILPAWHLQ